MSFLTSYLCLPALGRPVVGLRFLHRLRQLAVEHVGAERECPILRPRRGRGVTRPMVLEFLLCGGYLVNRYGYASDYKKSVHAKCFLNSSYFRGYGPGYGMLFRLFSAIRRSSRTRMSRRFLIQGISYNRMRTRSLSTLVTESTRNRISQSPDTLKSN